MNHPSANVGASTPTNLIQWDSSWPEWVKRPERNRLLGFLQKRFGIPRTVFANHCLFRRGSTIWLLSKDDRLSALASLRVQSVGLPLLRWVKSHLKPTSAALQLFGTYANKNTVGLLPKQLSELIEKRVIQGDFPVTSGYVIIAVEGVIFGCALYLPGRLISQFPRHLFRSQPWRELLPEEND